MKLGLVLSGGGMRGAAHIGAIKALQELDISPTHIAGTSAGAIVGALYAYGHSWQDIMKFFKSIQILDIKKYALNKPGFFDAEKFYPLFKTFIKNDSFEALEKELQVTATNLLKGNLEVFDKGELIRPLLASAAFPGVFAPVKIADSYYIDGGALNNFPVEILKDKCDITIGVYVNAIQDQEITDFKRSFNVVEHAFKMKSVKEDLKKFSACDLVISPKALSKYGTFDKKKLNEIFDIGYQSTVQAFNDNEELKMRLTMKKLEA
ncbi:MAG: patatin-like phospholipase family protein [Flavobacteriaceae bacterium]|nr:patatin-like phospholipase family protein [Bacteroidia bacterium]NNL61526.1 patatin-like phospholipase family protein [Flavobacteriaceae bacterium]